MYDFRSSRNKFRTIFWRLIFDISLPTFSSILKQTKPKLFVLEIWMERGDGKTINFVTLSIASKIFGKTILNPLYFERTQVALTFIAPLRIHFQWSKSTVDTCSLRSVFNVFRWTASLGTPNDTPHFSFQEEGVGSMKQKKKIVIP